MKPAKGTRSSHPAFARRLAKDLRAVFRALVAQPLVEVERAGKTKLYRFRVVSPDFNDDSGGAGVLCELLIIAESLKKRCALQEQRFGRRMVVESSLVYLVTPDDNKLRKQSEREAAR